MKTDLLYLIIVIIFLGSCSEKELVPINSSTGKPGLVTDINVVAIPGGADIYYKIPDTESLLGIKVVYSLNGKDWEVMVSPYENRLKIVGFNDQTEHTAMLYSVSRAMELSDPITVRFTPLKSGLQMAKESIEIKEDFSGVRFEWRNEVREKLTAELFGPDSLGHIKLLKIVQSDFIENVYPLRGYGNQSKELPFAILLRDNYGNSTDTISCLRTPMREDKIPKNDMRVMELGGDNPWNYPSGRPEFLLDDNFSTYGHSTITNDPVSITFNLGRKIRLSRLVLFQRNHRGYYKEGNVKTMEIFINNEEPDIDGNWDNWIKILDFTIEKPSGAPTGTETEEDVTAALNGFDILMPGEVETQYVRIRFTATWGNTSYYYWSELDVYGVELE